MCASAGVEDFPILERITHTHTHTVHLCARPYIFYDFHAVPVRENFSDFQGDSHVRTDDVFSSAEESEHENLRNCNTQSNYLIIIIAKEN